MDAAPSTFSLENLRLEQAAAYGVAATIVDQPSDDGGQQTEAVDRTIDCRVSPLATSIQETMAADKAAFLASCPNLRAAAQEGIRAAASAAADLYVHWRTRQ